MPAAEEPARARPEFEPRGWLLEGPTGGPQASLINPSINRSIGGQSVSAACPASLLLLVRHPLRFQKRWQALCRPRSYSPDSPGRGGCPVLPPAC